MTGLKDVTLSTVEINILVDVQQIGAVKKGGLFLTVQ